MRQISIVPYAGLANRMRAISSGIYIAKKLGASANIYWKREKNCYAQFNDLFNPIPVPGVRVTEISGFNLSLLRSTKKNLYIPSLLRRFIYNTQLTNFNIKTDGDIFSKLMPDGSIYLCSCNSMSNHYSMREIFHPQKLVITSIDKITAKFPEHVTGIHIRRTDNVKAIQNNSVEDFKKRIDKALTENTKMKFYLATDDIIVKQELLKTYEGHIITNNAVLNRNSSEGLINAVIDLWCLSRTNHIIGSFYSSYSEIAAEIGGIKLEIL
ncbi:MAG: hypothetical protein QM768_10565 [Agriterribacter sp.]